MSYLIFDNREHLLIDTFNKYYAEDISYEIQQMDLADIEIRGTKGQRFLFERKTVSDLAASLQDGRFKDQKDRLLGVLEREPKTAIAYILEGGMAGSDSQKVHGRVTMGMLRTLLNTIQLRYRIPIIRTTTIRDTASWVFRFVKHLERKPDFCPVGSGSNAGCSTYKTLMPSTAKNRSTDPKDIRIAMLTVIPGVSLKSASGILEQLETEEDTIFTFTRKNSKDAFIERLQGIKINNRKVSAKIVTQIVELFYSNPCSIAS